MMNCIGSNCMPPSRPPTPPPQQKMDVDKLASNLFSAIDSDQQGYIEKSELQTALRNARPAGADPAQGTRPGHHPTAEALFERLDGDSDGRVSEQEMTDSIQKLADQLQAQFRANQGTQADATTSSADLNAAPQSGTQNAPHDGRAMMHQLMSLAHYYGSVHDAGGAPGANLSATA